MVKAYKDLNLQRALNYRELHSTLSSSVKPELCSLISGKSQFSEIHLCAIGDTCVK